MKKIIFIVIILTIVLFSVFAWKAPSDPNPMTSAGEFHNVTVLPDGKVLVR